MSLSTIIFALKNSPLIGKTEEDLKKEFPKLEIECDAEDEVGHEIKSRVFIYTDDLHLDSVRITGSDEDVLSFMKRYS